MITASGHTTPLQSQRHTVIGDVHLLLHRGNKVLFGQRQGTGFADGAWHLPAGHLEAGESMLDAAIREAGEELGVRIGHEDLRFEHVMHSAASGGRIAFFFTAERWQGRPCNQEPDKCAGLQWFPNNALPEEMIAYCRTALGHIAGGTRSSVFGWDAPLLD
ncbi:NUDIX domain-containing protein [Nocardia sp. NPDC050712]|uniref:NUDIX hydrolase n=1 Tax=Nocardia sp. NPDC050712 TaxID=3155518 RepID=UPI003403D260